MPDTGSGIVYHYCSLETFKSIIENKCLWLCDVQKSNDSAERVFFENIALEQIDHYATHLQNESIADKEQRLQALQIVKKVLQGSETRRAPVYSCSFSCNGDQLSQWRGYGDDGYGVSLGFSKALLKTVPHRFDQVVYDKKRAQEVSQGIIKDSFRRAGSTESSQFFINQFVLSALRRIEQNSFFFKSEAFEEESEYRLAIQTDTTYYNNNESPTAHIKIERFSDWIKLCTPFTLSDRQYRITNHQLSSYYEFSFSAVKDEFLREIRLGPKCKVTPDDVRMFLNDRGYQADNITILPSEATYR